jgi:Trypsin-like peptidase domain
MHISGRRMKISPRKAILFLISTSLAIGSCGKEPGNPNPNIENSLIYLKIDLSENKPDGSPPDKSTTGFIIARENNKYYILTAKHGVKNANRISLIPYVAKEEKQVDRKTQQDFGSEYVFTSNDKNSLSVDSEIDLEGVDASIISVNTDNKLEVAKVKTTLAKDDKQLIMYGFVSCSNANSMNRDYFYHKTSGNFFTGQEFKDKDSKNFLDSLKKSEEKKKMMVDNDMKYTIPAKDGMSGSPIVDSSGEVIGMQIAIFSPQDAFIASNCTIQPDNKVSYGISMQKILAAKNFPSNVKSLIEKNNAKPK